MTNQEDDEYLNIGGDNDNDDSVAADVDDDVSSIGLNSSISKENRTQIGNRNRCESTETLFYFCYSVCNEDTHKYTMLIAIRI